MAETAPATLTGWFQERADQTPDRVALRHRVGDRWQDLTYGQVRARVEALTAALVEAGIEPGDRVSILAHNSPSWALVDWAILHAGAVSVPIYPTSTPEQVAYTLADAGSRLLFVGDQELLALVPSLDDAFDLEGIVAFESVESDDVEPLEAFEARGRELASTRPEAVSARWQGVAPEDLATLIYTSGTTGEPKGVMLSHGNITSNVQAGIDLLPMEDHETYLSFLPLSHSFERVLGHFAMVRLGATIWYAQGVETLLQDLQEARPTTILAVPRLYEKLRAGVLEKVREAPSLRQALFDWAVGVGERVRVRHAGDEPVPPTLALQHTLADRLVLSKLRRALGMDRIHLAGSGGAALEPEVARFFHQVGVSLVEGYGLTEASPIVSISRPDAVRIGTVGEPIPNVEVRIDEQGWDGEPGEGEVLVHGPNVMQGYWNKPTETAEALDDEGWLHTGDVGRLDEQGHLHITDRKKELFKTAYGKYVAPQQVEGLLQVDPLVDQAVALGAERKYVSALLVPDLEALEAWARRQNGLSFESILDVLGHERVRARFQQAVDHANGQLARHEQVKQWTLLHRGLSVGEELTPTLKVKRRVVEDRFANEIEGLYADA